MKKRLAILALLAAFVLPVGAAPYRTYTYVNASDGIYAVEAPAAYIPADILDAQRLGVDLQAPEDLYSDSKGNFYISDKDGGAVHAFDGSWKRRFTISSFDKNGEEDALNGPEGLCVDREGCLWVADTENQRLLRFDANGKFLKELGAPSSPLLDENFEFFPMKFVVDDVDRIFVVCRHVYDGLVQLSLDGQFVGYVGSNYATANWYEQFWQAIMTDEQNSKRLAFIAMEYANICLDDSGFLYVNTAVSDVENPIRRLNPSGEDVLMRHAVNGITKVAGDLIYPEDSPPSIVDVAVGNTGIYYALDGTRGRVFAYDEDGNMLFVFGGINTYQQGTFRQPCSLIIRGDDIYVLDRDNRSVTMFRPTDYALNIYSATRTYRESNYTESLNLWESILKQNSNLDLAYDKAGFALYRMGEYKTAMDYFAIANDRDNYSMAMVKYRKEWMSEHFTLCTAVLAGGITLLVLWRIWLRRRRRRAAKGDSGQ